MRRVTNVAGRGVVTRFELKIPETLKARAQAAADADGRALAAWIKRLIERELSRLEKEAGK
jgi:predicted HicB family RNase H-like nuclease